MSEQDKDTDKKAADAEAAEDTKASPETAKADESESETAKAEESDEKAEASDEKAEDSDEKAEDSDEEASDEESEDSDEKASDEKAEDSDEKAEAEDSDEKSEDSDEKAEAEASDEKSDEPAAAKAASDDDHGDDDDDDDDAELDADEEGEVYGLLAEFRSPGELIAAAEKVRDAGFTQWDCYSPFPVHGIDPAMGIKRTILPVVVFVIGVSGLAGGLLLQWWANAYNWPWIISGKPFFSIPANIPITFETTILASAFATFFSMWILNKLPQVWHPFFKKDRFLKVTDDGFFIGVEAADPKYKGEKTEALLREAGALEIEVCHLDADPKRRSLPRPLLAFIVTTIILALIPLALIAKARTSKSKDPHVHIFPDMDFQQKFKSQRPNDLFDDYRASRMPVEGTVARNQLKADDFFYRGIRGGQWVTNFPGQFPVSSDMIKRGQSRFNIYCQPCHGTDGAGKGMIQQRTNRLQPDAKAGWAPPSNLNDVSIVRQPHGQLFNTIGNGIRTMPGYAAQIPEEDRWAIVLYLRALQRSQNAVINDVPTESRNLLQ